VSRPVARYRPSRRYFLFALMAICGALFSTWTGLRWSYTWIAAGLFALSAAAILVLVLRPVIEIHETHLRIGRRVIFWNEIRRLDQTRWTAPLAMHLTLADQRKMLLIYPGDLDSSTSLLRHLRRYSREALLDGIPYRQFWGEPSGPASGAAARKRQPPPPRYPLLRPEDEEEVERMFQRLKSVGRMDQRGSDEQ
jgi:hypothetical protein